MKEIIVDLIQNHHTYVKIEVICEDEIRWNADVPTAGMLNLIVNRGKRCSCGNIVQALCRPEKAEWGGGGIGVQQGWWHALWFLWNAMQEFFKHCNWSSQKKKTKTKNMSSSSATWTTESQIHRIFLGWKRPQESAFLGHILVKAEMRMQKVSLKIHLCVL